ncbi:MAG: hydrogenase maturation nickel metallochaperone HypA [Bacteroidales bacterium]|nr:hydrogenase maturation nickel metallochaperone HypA [Bacteroidales bacterium]
MHEFSLASEVVKIAAEEAAKNNARLVSEIAVEVGDLSGVDTGAFQSAMEILSEGSILDKARLNIIRIKGKGFCQSCNLEFEMDHRIDACPVCNSFPSEIRGGYEFRVVSLTIEEVQDETFMIQKHKRS